jgi:hypothetical protein
LLYHPGAAGQCKNAAVKVLEARGGFENDDDEYDDDNDDEAKEQPEEQVMMLSVLSADAAILGSSLDGSDDTTRGDWIESVKGCKTMSRMASLVAAFAKNAKDKMTKLEGERDGLYHSINQWEKEEERRVKSRTSKKPSTGHSTDWSGPSEVWANVRFTDEICMAKAEDWPWWPARMCRPKDPSLAQTLASLNRSLVALIGETGSLRVVTTENIQSFTGKQIEVDMSMYSKHIRSQLDDCMSMGRRISRGLQSLSNGKQKASKK